jgi:hypothetical protein
MVSCSSRHLQDISRVRAPAPALSTTQGCAPGSLLADANIYSGWTTHLIRPFGCEAAWLQHKILDCQQLTVSCVS